MSRSILGFPYLGKLPFSQAAVHLRNNFVFMIAIRAGSVRDFATCDLGPRTKLLDAAGTTRPDCRSTGSMRFIARLPRSSWSTRNSHPKEGSVNKSRVLNTELTVKSGSPLIRFHIC